jgi:hypothetical protein
MVNLKNYGELKTFGYAYVFSVVLSFLIYGNEDFLIILMSSIFYGVFIYLIYSATRKVYYDIKADSKKEWINNLMKLGFIFLLSLSSRIYIFGNGIPSSNRDIMIVLVGALITTPFIWLGWSSVSKKKS